MRPMQCRVAGQKCLIEGGAGAWNPTEGTEDEAPDLAEGEDSSRSCPAGLAQGGATLGRGGTRWWPAEWGAQGPTGGARPTRGAQGSWASSGPKEMGSWLG